LIKLYLPSRHPFDWGTRLLPTQVEGRSSGGSGGSRSKGEAGPSQTEESCAVTDKDCALRSEESRAVVGKDCVLGSDESCAVTEAGRCRHGGLCCRRRGCSACWMGIGAPACGGGIGGWLECLIKLYLPSRHPFDWGTRLLPTQVEGRSRGESGGLPEHGEAGPSQAEESCTVTDKDCAFESEESCAVTDTDCAFGTEELAPSRTAMIPTWVGDTRVPRSNGCREGLSSFDQPLRPCPDATHPRCQSVDPHLRKPALPSTTPRAWS
jgi:hypothetical protein